MQDKIILNKRSQATKLRKMGATCYTHISSSDDHVHLGKHPATTRWNAAVTNTLTVEFLFQQDMTQYYCRCVNFYYSTEWMCTYECLTNILNYDIWILL